MNPASIRPARRNRARRRYAGVLAATLLGLVAALLPTLTASAADGPFSIDGTVPDMSPAPAELPDVSGNVKELGPLNSNTTKIGVIHDDVLPTLGRTNPNAQVDLRRAWLATARDQSTNHDWLYFAWERDSNSGSGFIAYEFMKNAAPAACDYDGATEASLIANCNPWANRTAGDFLITWDQQGNSLDLALRVWSGPDDNLTLGPPVDLNDAESQAAYSADGFRGEAAVDLTATIFGGVSRCLSFANTIPSTVTGNSDTADYKDTILQHAPPITNCTSTTTTTPQTVSGGTGTDITGPVSIGSGVVAVRDKAVVALTGGSATPAGSVTFALCKLDGTALCTSGGTSVGTTDLSGSAYPVTVFSPTAYVTSVGRYCWRATFSGDTANGIPGSSDSSASECFTVSPVTPTLTTTAGQDVTLGNAVTDRATLSGLATDPASPVINTTGAAGPPAGGTVTFKLYGPSDTGCGNLVGTTAAVPVSGNGNYDTPAPQLVPTAPGDYHWVAVYSGSTNNNTVTHNALCDDTAEDVTVSTVPTSLTSAQSWVPNDSVTVSATAGGNLAGTVTFDLYPNATCSGTAIYSATRSVSGASPRTVSTSNTTSVTASGTFSWKVAYDSTNTAQEDIAASCHETSVLTVTNGGTITSSQ